MSKCKFAIWLMLAIVLVSLFSLPQIPTAQATTYEATLNSTSSDGDIENFGAVPYDTYLEVWSATSGWMVINTATTILGGQYGAPSGWQIHRDFLYFDTSILPDNATIMTAEIGLYVTLDGSATDFNVTVQTGGTLYPHDPLQLSDYWKDYYSGDGGTLDTSTISTLNTYYNITLNTSGKAMISLDSMTKLALRSSRDIAGTEPLGYEYIQIANNEYGESAAPKLYLTYTVDPNIVYLHGAYDEDGNRDGAINVTFYRIGETPEVFELDGDYNATCQSVEGNVFNFELGNNESRVYYIRDYFEDVYVFRPSDPYYNYYFTVLDYVGVTNAYLESLIYVNGTQRVVERWSLDIVKSDIPFVFSWGHGYIMRLVSDQGTYVYGTFIASSTTSFVLPISQSMFATVTGTIYDINATATRENATWIQVNYADAVNGTVWVYVAIYTLGEDTPLYYTNNTGFIQQINWYDAEESIDYAVIVQCYHQDYGELSWSFPLGSGGNNMVGSWGTLFDWLGDFPIEARYMVGMALCLVVFSIFSAYNAPFGMVVTFLVAGFLNYIQWLNIATSWFAGVGCMVVLIVISYYKERHPNL